MWITGTETEKAGSVHGEIYSIFIHQRYRIGIRRCATIIRSLGIPENFLSLTGCAHCKRNQKNADFFSCGKMCSNSKRYQLFRWIVIEKGAMKRLWEFPALFFTVSVQTVCILIHLTSRLKGIWPTVLLWVLRLVETYFIVDIVYNSLVRCSSEFW